MRIFFPLLAVLLLTATACTKTREYRSADGAVVATCQYSGSDSTHAEWHFTDAKGLPLMEGYDSLRVVERGPEGHPATVCFHYGKEQRWRQYYPNMQLRGEGSVVDGLRQGLWVFYFPDGTKQAEGTFVAGREEGPYKVYRENGVPYYIGQYHQGQPCGTWEVYNPDGSLATTQQYQ